MSKAVIVKSFMEAAGKNDMATAVKYLADNFTFSGPTPQPLGKQEFLGFQGAMAAAMPDFSFNLRVLEEQGNTVKTAVHITGTQTSTLDLSAMGIPVIPATERVVALPEECPVFTFEGDKIANIYTPPVQGGGMPGVLQQLGVALPAH